MGVVANGDEKDKCDILIDIKNKIYVKRLKIQKKLRKKRYKKKGLRIFKRYLTTKEYLYILYFHKKLVKNDKIPTDNLRNFVKLFLKFECANLFFRDYFLGIKTQEKYKKMTEKSFYSYDKRVVLDNVVIGIILKKTET